MSERSDRRNRRRRRTGRQTGLWRKRYWLRYRQQTGSLLGRRQAIGHEVFPTRTLSWFRREQISAPRLARDNQRKDCLTGRRQDLRRDSNRSRKPCEYRRARISRSGRWFPRLKRRDSRRRRKPGLSTSDLERG